MAAESTQASGLGGESCERWKPGVNPVGRESVREESRFPGEQPITDDIPPIDHAPVPPLTTEDDVEGG